jgi:septal ring factor EnvC (AmiA/AmiB activator)
MKTGVLISALLATALSSSWVSAQDAEMQSKIDAARSQVQENEQTIDGLQNKLLTQRDLLSNNESEISEKSERISELERQISEMQAQLQ